jgi:signal transduction histidine kinase
MKRLYLQVYATVVASLLVFAVVAGALWWFTIGQLAPRHPSEVLAEAAQNLPDAGAPREAQGEAVRRIARRLRGDVALYAADRSLIAEAGRPLPAPEAGRGSGGWLRRRGQPPAWSARLADGRWLIAHVPRDYFWRARRPGPLLVLALLVVAVGVGVYPVVRRVTRRLENLRAGVEALGAGELRARVGVEGDDEVARLAESFNAAAARIERLMGAHRTLLANASHELRTPLARIRIALELIRAQVDPRRRAELEHDVAELDALIEEILLASRLDAVPGLEATESVDLLALAAEECARYDAVALDGEPVAVRGDLRLLRRLVRNLLENARRHGAPPVTLRISRTAHGAEIDVCDHGAGVPAPERERVFEPFYRRPGASEGAGLGLALVRQIAQRHGGEARCAPGEGGGCCFSVTLAASPGKLAL